MLFQSVSSYFQLMRSSSIKDFFHGDPLPSDQNFFDCFELQWSRPTTLIKQVMLFSSYFTTIPDGRAADGRLEKSILRLTWAELGNSTQARALITCNKCTKQYTGMSINHMQEVYKTGHRHEH
jgi:hypothetical protein